MMTTEAKRSALARAGRAANTATTTRSAGSKTGEMYYIILQGDVLEMEAFMDFPNLEVLPGERRKQVVYASADKVAAEAKMQEMAPRARGVVGKGEAY
jgi:hypothetical protein